MLTVELVKPLALPEVWDRGERYFRTGRVSHAYVEKHPDTNQFYLGGTVSGSELYAPTIRGTLSPGKNEGKVVLTGDCTCPYSGEGWCKHLVALALAEIHGKAMIVDAIPVNDWSIKKVWEYIQDMPAAAQEMIWFQLLAKRPLLREQVVTALSLTSPSIHSADKSMREIIQEEIDQLLPLLAQDPIPTAEIQQILRSRTRVPVAEVYRLLTLDQVLTENGFTHTPFIDHQSYVIHHFANLLIPFQTTKQALTLIFDRWVRLDREGKVPVHFWEFWTPMLIALTADPVAIQFLRTKIEGYGLGWDLFPRLAEWIEELGGNN